MEQIMRKPLILTKKKKAEYERLEFTERLLFEIRETCRKKRNLANRYSQVYDDDLIESIIYEELSLKSKFSYLTKIARENGVEPPHDCVFM